MTDTVVEDLRKLWASLQVRGTGHQTVQDVGDLAKAAADQLEQLRLVALAARNLVTGARDMDLTHAKVDEASLVVLEEALANAGYDADVECAG